MKSHTRRQTRIALPGAFTGLPAKAFLALFPLLTFSLAVTAAPSDGLRSPDGNLKLNFVLKNLGGMDGCPVYRITYKDRPVLADSRLGLQLKSGPLNSGFKIVNSTRRSGKSTWSPVCGERSLVRDEYNEAEIELRQTTAPNRSLRITFRVYDAGVAFSYTLPEQPGLKDFTITSEESAFTFTADHKAWVTYNAQGNYSEVPLSALRPGVERPLTVKLADDLYAAIAEAKLVNYARMKLRPAKEPAHTVEALLDGEPRSSGEVTGSTPFTSPWRVVMVAPSPGELLEQNDIILNLNDPCAIADTSWIKPGKVVRDISLSTAGGKACVDFAVRQGLQYVLYDAGWYGHEYDNNASALAVNLDPRRNPDPDSLNLQEVIDYGKSKGIGIILYVNRRALEKQIDQLLPLYEKWGVKGVKYGFVNVGSQKWTAWLHEAVRKAADHHLMVDIHDEYRPTGYSRTYPNLMTVEGVLGNEAFPTAANNAALPFTRLLAGPADATFCWYDGRLKNTKAHQLALSTIFFSPWQFVYWYDKPSAFDGDKALDYWKALPTTWDETKVLHGGIGSMASIARRKGNEWFIGTIQPGGPREVDIPLAFLAPGKKFTATIYADESPNKPASKAVKIETRQVNSSTVLKTQMPPNGGQAVHIVPAD